MYSPCPPTSFPQPTPPLTRTAPRCPPTPISTPHTCPILTTTQIQHNTSASPPYPPNAGALLRQTRAATRPHTTRENTETAQRRKRRTVPVPTAKRLTSPATIVGASLPLLDALSPLVHSASLSTLHKTRHGWKLRRGPSQKGKVSPRR